MHKVSEETVKEHSIAVKEVLDKYNNLLTDYFGKNSLFSDEMKKLLKTDFEIKMKNLIQIQEKFYYEKFVADLKNQ